MARSRNIKPAFFTNDELAEIDPLGRLLFIGLWTIADFKGELEWREKRIKAQILPYDNCDIKKIAINLDNSGFIRFYSNTNKIYLKVDNFTKHQNPHKNERIKGSDIPVYDENSRQVIDFNALTINRDKYGLNHDENGTTRADSLNLIPDSFNPDPLLKDIHQLVVDEYEKVFNGELPMVAKLSTKRKSAINGCIKQMKGTKHDFSEIETWSRYFNYASESNFLMGRSTEWKMDFDFLVTKSKMLKIIEGGYDNK